jgi:RNA polymerase sigma-70 factor (ECF subfamily)
MLLDQYEKPIRRYLLGALRNEEAADELFQEFALRFLRGAFKSADPECGRFRDFVKTVLYHLIVDYLKAQGKRPLPLPQDLPERADRDFLESWLETLMERTWWSLAQLEQQTGQPCHTVLLLRTEQPKLSSAELAEQLGQKLGKSFTIHAARQALHRAREKFADLLLDEVIHSLDDPTVEQVEQELIELGLKSYCQSAWKRRAGLGC